MSKYHERAIIAALIAKLGGEVTLYPRDIIEAEDFELVRWDDPASGGIRLTATPPAVELIGEVVEDEPRALPGGTA